MKCKVKPAAVFFTISSKAFFGLLEQKMTQFLNDKKKAKKKSLWFKKYTFTSEWARKPNKSFVSCNTWLQNLFH